MKKKYVFAIFFAAIAFFACRKELPTQLEFELYAFTSADENGGQWTPILLHSPGQVIVPTPVPVTAAAYQQELAELKALTASLTSSQKADALYWGNNPMLRWNEIARELAAKYNLPPAPNPDGTYSAPNPANPGVYPFFPFAHPPYACRMFAYLSAAQFDALIASWHHMYTFNRPAPHTIDSDIQTLFPDSPLPTYPANGAAVAGVAQVILTAMFPLEKDFIAQKADNHRMALMWAGQHVKSDVEAGDVLGRAVADIFLDRARTDGMSQAQAPRPVSDSLRDAAQTQFGWAWKNLEDPPRPVGITPLFGRVKPWCIVNIADVRPPAPPAPESLEFEKDVAELRQVAKNLTAEQRRIANFWSDGPGTYTPPGHWNRIAAEAIVKNKMNPLRTARTFAYMNMAIMDAGISCWDAKYYYYYPRPIQVIPGFKTILATPNFPAYTSGHSTFSAAAATVLSHIFPQDAARFDQQAQEAAMSRIYGGIHFRFDADIGNLQGKVCGQLAVQIAQADGAE